MIPIKHTSRSGKVSRISGSLISAKDIQDPTMYELVKIGEKGIFGEIIQISGEKCQIQAYEDTEGIKLGEKVIGSGKPLSVDLGPGLMGGIYDGIQRPLKLIAKKVGPFIQRGLHPPSINRTKKWTFHPSISPGIRVNGGEIIGEVHETPSIIHKILIPPNISGLLESVSSKGDYTVEEPIAKVKTTNGFENIFLMQSWPVRKPRPYKKKMNVSIPLLTGQRIIDAFYPIAKGGIVTVIGGFGTGKTVLLQTIATRVHADVIIYIGCGERGNEIADIMQKFTSLKIPGSEKSLMSKSILIANTSNMPILAREASIYCGITIAEYYRDMGYDVAIMADSTSRWAESLREISGRLEEMPGEEGYPAYLASRLAEFYSRAGNIFTFGNDNRKGSLTILASISPPGGDFSEPVTKNTLRLTKVFWALDFNLAHRRHYPAINWFLSYSEYFSFLEDWFKQIDWDWVDLINAAKALLREEQELKEIVSLVGADILGDKQRSVFEIAKMVKSYFLLQNAYHPVDVYCPIQKTIKMLKIILKFSKHTKKAVKSGVSLENILKLAVKYEISQLKYKPTDKFEESYQKIQNSIEESFKMLLEEVSEEMEEIENE